MFKVTRHFRNSLRDPAPIMPQTGLVTGVGLMDKAGFPTLDITTTQQETDK